jgi:hypothetical protein
MGAVARERPEVKRRRHAVPSQLLHAIGAASASSPAPCGRRRMIRRRAMAAGIETELGNHSFRATRITASLTNGGTPDEGRGDGEPPQGATHLYDRRRDEVSVSRFKQKWFTGRRAPRSDQGDGGIWDMKKQRALVFLLYQKGRASRIFQAQDRAIDDFKKIDAREDQGT